MHRFQICPPRPLHAPLVFSSIPFLLSPAFQLTEPPLLPDASTGELQDTATGEQGKCFVIPVFDPVSLTDASRDSIDGGSWARTSGKRRSGFIALTRSHHHGFFY
jgi:hypothetical protein